MIEGKIEIGTRSTSSNGCSLEIRNLTHEEKESLEGSMTHGSSWTRVDREEGRLKTHPVFAPFPDPVEDKDMHPFWRGPSDEERQLAAQPELLTFGEMGHSYPSYFISHLCGYNYTPENYRKQAERLTSYGFVEMRSSRGVDGKFWEKWYLPGDFIAKGELQEKIEELDRLKIPQNQKVNEIVSFLCCHVQFGTLDVVIQRAAMVVDD